MTDSDTCKSCKFYKPSGSRPSYGYCRRYPPKLNTDSGETYFVTVEEINWCGEFAELSEPLQRETGAIWKTDEGWFGMSSDGESGPWKNEQAALAASKNNFERATRYNAREPENDT